LPAYAGCENPFYKTFRHRRRLPALEAIKSIYPASELTWVVEEAAAGIPLSIRCLIPALQLSSLLPRLEPMPMYAVDMSDYCITIICIENVSPY